MSGFHTNSTCLEKPPVLKDHFLLTTKVVFPSFQTGFAVQLGQGEVLLRLLPFGSMWSSTLPHQWEKNCSLFCQTGAPMTISIISY